MAAEDETSNPNPDTPTGPVPFWESPMGRNFLWATGVAAVLAMMAGVWMWYQQPEYKVLFSNYSDRDGGAIVASLQQLNIPYKFSDAGNAILVPSENVHDARLKLASQGLPKGGNVGFELMENQKLGVSQFLEQVNFQRALEGELARSIESLGAVVNARVHLALPKPSVFVREQQKPTASVILTLHPNRTLELTQVAAISHLVSSSVPELLVSNVTIVDQAGSLLSDQNKQGKTLDPNQLKYVAMVQQNIVKQVESIVTPIVGPNNVRAEATAEIDFAQTEQAAEKFAPNQPPAAATVRSQQTSETQGPGGNTASGVPGALTNQPPAPATAPIVASGPNATTASANGNSHKESTTNFEVDKKVTYSTQGMGAIKRLSVAVVVNYKRFVDKNNKVRIEPLTEAEKKAITDLVRETVGFNKDRGDALTVTNTPFDGVDKPPEPPPPPPPWWKDPENWAIAKEVGKFLLMMGILAYLFFVFLRPLLRPLFRKLDEMSKPPEAPVEEEPEEEVEEVVLDEEEVAKATALQEMEAKQNAGYRENLQTAKNLAKEDPRVVANVIKAWVGANE